MSLQYSCLPYVSTTFVCCTCLSNICVLNMFIQLVYCVCLSIICILNVFLQRSCVSGVCTIFVFHMSTTLVVSCVSATFVSLMCLYNFMCFIVSATFVSLMSLQSLCFVCLCNICFLHVSTIFVFLMCLTTFVFNLYQRSRVCVCVICMYNICALHMSLHRFFATFFAPVNVYGLTA
jgi:hypothetical protein